MLENVNGFTVSVEDYVVEAGGIAEFVRKEVAADAEKNFEYLWSMRNQWDHPTPLGSFCKGNKEFVLELGQTGFVKGSDEENVRFVIDLVLPGDGNDDVWIKSWELDELDRLEAELMEILKGTDESTRLAGLI